MTAFVPTIRAAQEDELMMRPVFKRMSLTNRMLSRVLYKVDKLEDKIDRRTLLLLESIMSAKDDILAIIAANSAKQAEILDEVGSVKALVVSLKDQNDVLAAKIVELQAAVDAGQPVDLSDIQAAVEAQGQALADTDAVLDETLGNTPVVDPNPPVDEDDGA